MTQVELKVAFPVDDAELSALHSRAFGSATGGDAADRVAITPWAQRLQRHSLTWIGAFDAHTLVGFAHAIWDGGAHAFILDTVVDPDYQRQGIGTRLVNAVANEAFRAGCAWVHVDYTAENAQFYQESCGFTPTAAGLRARRGDDPQSDRQR